MIKTMKQIKWTGLIIALLASVLCSPVMAHGGHYRGHGGFSFGFYPGFPAPYYLPYYQPYYAYPPAVVTIPAQPPVYIQQYSGQTNQRLPPNYWYYCRNPDGYYPYVRECPGGWQQVAPQPPTR